MIKAEVTMSNSGVGDENGAFDAFHAKRQSEQQPE